MQSQPGDGSYDGPPLTDPQLGQPIVAGGEHAYRTRASAERQAERWNELLELDPTHGPMTGLQVGAAPLASEQADGRRWELIWIAVATSASCNGEERVTDEPGARSLTRLWQRTAGVVTPQRGRTVNG